MRADTLRRGSRGRRRSNLLYWPTSIAESPKKPRLISEAADYLRASILSCHFAQEASDALMEAFLDGTLDFDGHRIEFREQGTARWLTVDGVCMVPQSEESVRRMDARRGAAVLQLMSRREA